MKDALLLLLYIYAVMGAGVAYILAKRQEIKGPAWYKPIAIVVTVLIWPLLILDGGGA
jgi:hypothetical protein